MKGSIRRLAFVSAALAALVALPFSAQSQDDPDPAAREWTQARGNAARTSASVVEPLTGEPLEAWKFPLPGPAVSEPVTWGGAVFVAVQKDKTRKLLAFDVASGAPGGEKDLGAGGRVGLATWQGVVLAADATQIRAFPYQAGKFSSTWTVRGAFGAPPCVWRGLCFACDGNDLLCIDIAKGGTKKAKTQVVDPKILASLDETKSMKGAVAGGAVSVNKSRADGSVNVVVVSSMLNVVLWSKSRVDDPFGAKTQLRPTTTEVLGILPHNVSDDDRWDMIPCRVEAPAGEGGETAEPAKLGNAWIVVGPRSFTDGAGARAIPDGGTASPIMLSTQPAAVLGQAIAFAPLGALQSWKPNGDTRTIVSPDNYSGGTRRGPATAAGGVGFAGGLAFEIDGDKLLWTLRHDAVTPLVPAGDRRLVFATRTEFICVADASMVAAPPPPQSVIGENKVRDGGTVGSAEVVVTAAPRDVDGVLLDDGRQIEGTFDRTDPADRSKITIHPKDGSVDVVTDAAHVVSATTAGEVDIRGDDGAAYRVWRGALRAGHCDALEAVFQDYAKALLLDDARRVLQRMRENGAAEARVQKLEASLAGKVARSDPPRAKKIAPQEDAARSALAEGWLQASAWCAKRDLETAASVSLVEVSRLRGTVDAALDERVRALIPSAFPWADASDATRRWMTWSESLLASSARFIERNDDTWQRLRGEPWASGSPVALRTRNVILFSMDDDVVVCGRALQLAEGTVRALQVFFSDGKAESVLSDQDRLEVRIHKNRKAYLAEQGAGGRAPEWSGGYFSPAEGISRFYVARDGKNLPADLAELGRVLTHELTHHYMEVRWMRGAAEGGPGYWVVEGMARFVENQAIRMETRGLAFDDATVPNLESMAQAERRKDALFKSAASGDFPGFLDMDYSHFSALGNDSLFSVNTRDGGGRDYTQRGLWYDQAGALCFFFLWKRGDAARANFVEYVRLHYQGKAPKSGWRFLGYETPEALDKEFGAFLAGLRGGG